MTLKEQSKKEIENILNSDNLGLIKALFTFDRNDTDEQVLFKFNLWARFFLSKYFQKKGVEPIEYYQDAEFHKEIDQYNLKAYREEFIFVDVAFRGASKTSRTKMFIAFAIANDLDHFRKYIKVLSADIVNARQIITDIYNIFVQPKIRAIYPEIFAKGNEKREETMSSFTTATGVKLLAETVGVSQRGALQEDSRPDLILFEDIEDQTTIRSAVKTHAIWENMEEARTSLAVGGSCIYNANYISEAGNVHKLVTKKTDKKKVLIVPILDEQEQSAWPDMFPLSAIEQMKKVDVNFEGEKMCKPSASKEVFFDRPSVEKQVPRAPIKVISGFKIFKEPVAGHFYAGGHDVSGGVGLDSSTSVFIDFSSYPAEVVATYADNTIKPEMFGYEIKRQADYYGGCLVCPEKNLGGGGDTSILVLRQQNCRICQTQPKNSKIMLNTPTEYGWRTDDLTKNTMMGSLANAIIDGLIILNDEDLINEVKGYTRNNLIETVKDPRLVTRHFDILIACAIAWQMKDNRFLQGQRKVTTTRPKIIRNI